MTGALPSWFEAYYDYALLLLLRRGGAERMVHCVVLV